MLRNANAPPTAPGLGGMLAFLTVGTGTPSPLVDLGPSVSLLGLSLNPTNGVVAVTVSATITDAVTFPTNISAAEFYIDSTAGSPNIMIGTFNSTSVSCKPCLRKSHYLRSR
jgi:hypothetical protein